MAKPTEPHFRYPFTFGAGADKHALVNQQGTEDEIIDAVIVIVKTPVGFRDDLPEFGIQEQVFQQQPLAVNDITSALENWEERAAYKVLTDPNFVDALSTKLLIYVQSEVDA